ncbi:MAG: aspartate kinase [Methylococcaceae bacterium TMED69]|nr:MAG: aspartate kinase [Methylococcaceae bacterium TMED69]
MASLVLKFGGTSVGSAEAILLVADKVKKLKEEGNSLAVVVSAMSGETNRLLDLANKFKAEKGKAVDFLLATGEQVSVALLCSALESLGVICHPMAGWQVPIQTDNSFGKAKITEITPDNIVNLMDDGVVVITGFQGVDQSNNITTLGRGGSDTSAVAIAAAIGADECRIYTDVRGVFTTDPRIVSDARKLDVITYEEMLELAGLGAKVLQIRAVEFARNYNVKLRVLSTFNEDPGTLIIDEEEGMGMEQALISGITLKKNEAQIMLSNVPDRPGIAADILGPVAEKNIEVDMIVQNIGSNGIADFTFTVPKLDFDETVMILNNLSNQLGGSIISGDDKIVKLSIVGVGMRSHAGIASKMFSVLAAENINIKMISTSEIKISVVIEEKYGELAVRCLHTAFELQSTISK